MNRIPTLSALALVCLLTGCQTTIPIRSMQPGPISVGATDHLVLLKGEGRRSAREDVAHEVVNQCRAAGQFSVEDRSEDPIFVRVAGGQVQIDGDATVLAAPTRAGLKIDVLDLDCHEDTESVETVDAEGRRSFRNVRVRRGKALIAVTLFDGHGRAFLAEREYDGQVESRDLQANREDLQRDAMRMAVMQFLGDITPREVVTHVQLDDEDEGQVAIIETAKAGNIAQAAADAESYANANPRNPAAAYNLAVLLDAMGDFERALTWYDTALRLGTKDFYTTARAQCARRLGDRDALRATPGR